MEIKIGGDLKIFLGHSDTFKCFIFGKENTEWKLGHSSTTKRKWFWTLSRLERYDWTTSAQTEQQYFIFGLREGVSYWTIEYSNPSFFTTSLTMDVIDVFQLTSGVNLRLNRCSNQRDYLRMLQFIIIGKPFSNINRFTSIYFVAISFNFTVNLNSFCSH